MAKHVAYVGTSDVRKLSKADFAKLGVEDGKTVTFHRGQPQELDDELADVLVNSDLLTGEFKEVEEGEELRLSAVRGTTGTGSAPASDAVAVASGGPVTGRASSKGGAAGDTETGGARRGRAQT